MTPDSPKTWDWNRTGSGSKPSLCLISQRKTPTRWLSSLCTVNKHNAKRDDWTARTASCLDFFFLLTALFFVTQKEIGRGRWEVRWLMGKGSQTKLKTEKTKWITLRWFQLFGLSWNNSISLTWQTFGCIFMGRGNMATAAFFRDLKSLRLKFFKFHLPSSLLILSHPLWTLTCRFRDDVVMF